MYIIYAPDGMKCPFTALQSPYMYVYTEKHHLLTHVSSHFKANAAPYVLHSLGISKSQKINNAPFVGSEAKYCLTDPIPRTDHGEKQILCFHLRAKSVKR